jgi:hypothetical protein
VADDAPFRAYKGHASHVTCVRFSCDDTRVLSAGGKDRALLQFITHGVRLQPHVSTVASSADGEQQSVATARPPTLQTLQEPLLV